MHWTSWKMWTRCTASAYAGPPEVTSSYAERAGEATACAGRGCIHKKMERMITWSCKLLQRLDAVNDFNYKFLHHLIHGFGLWRWSWSNTNQFYGQIIRGSRCDVHPICECYTFILFNLQFIAFEYAIGASGCTDLKSESMSWKVEWIGRTRMCVWF